MIEKNTDIVINKYQVQIIVLMPTSTLMLSILMLSMLMVVIMVFSNDRSTDRRELLRSILI